MALPVWTRRRKMLLVATTLAAACAVWVLSMTSGETIAVTVVRATRGPIAQYVRATGHVEPEERVRVSARVTGELVELKVTEGSQVKKGDLLALINPGVAQQQVNQRLAQSKSFQAQVRLEEAKLARALKKEQSTRSLHQRGLVSQAEIADAQEEVRIARAQVQSAQHRATQALAEVAEEQTKLGFATVRAVADGTILSLDRRQGERVRGSDLAEDVLLTLAPLDKMRVDIEVSEHEVVHLKVGDSADIRLRPLENLQISGEIDAIAAAATVYSRGQLNEVTRFKVSVRLSSVPPTLRPGMTAEVRLVAQSRDNAVLVPYDAVTSRSTSELGPAAAALATPDSGLAATTAPNDSNQALVVFVNENGVARIRPIVTGLASDKQIEILSGLNPDEVVITGPFDALAKQLQDGTSIEADEPPAPLPAPVTTGPVSAGNPR